MTGSVTFKHQYNAAGNTTLAYMTLDNGGSSVNNLFTAYTYDSHNRLSTVVDNNLLTGANTTTYLYDLVGTHCQCHGAKWCGDHVYVQFAEPID